MFQIINLIQERDKKALLLFQYFVNLITKEKIKYANNLKTKTENELVIYADYLMKANKLKKEADESIYKLYLFYDKKISEVVNVL